jgi:dihydrofolate synthase / folylpolyglutamate synthase
MDYNEALRYLYSFTNYERVMPRVYSSTSFSLEKAEALMALLDHPERQFRSIHVAGTKGKGSTAQMIQRILIAAGQRVALYTQPHLHTHRERIRINDQLISPHELAAIVSDFPDLVTRYAAAYPHLPPPSTFELGTALAFLHFARNGVDWAVIEVGIGGRLDTTNVISPQVGVITSISFDHCELLGHTLALIAAEKAGIIKPGLDVISAPQVAEVAQVIAAKAQREAANLNVVGEALWVDPTRAIRLLSVNKRWVRGQSFTLYFAPDFPGRGANLPPTPVILPLLGLHQRDNAAAAVGAALLLTRHGLTLPANAIEEGLAAAHWPGRLELLEDKPGQPLFVVDGAHNGDSAARLRDALAPGLYFNRNRLILIIGIIAPHPIADIITPLAAIADTIILTRASHPRAIDPPTLLAEATDHVSPSTAVLTTDSVAEAIRVARLLAQPDDLICATGSLFVVADAREALGVNEYPPDLVRSLSRHESSLICNLRSDCVY